MACSRNLKHTVRTLSLDDAMLVRPAVDQDCLVWGLFVSAQGLASEFLWSQQRCSNERACQQNVSIQIAKRDYSYLYISVRTSCISRSFCSDGSWIL